MIKKQKEQWNSIPTYAMPFMQLIKIPQALIKLHETAQLAQHMP